MFEALAQTGTQSAIETVQAAESLRFYQVILAALIAIESILLSVFGNLLGVYARYKTTSGAEDAPIAETVANRCIHVCILIFIVACLAVYALVEVYLSVGSLLPLWFLILIGALIIAISAPAIHLTMKMR